MVLHEVMSVINRVLDNRYKILEPLGSGGSGTVYKGMHLKLNVLIAIKCMQKKEIETQKTIREVEILKHLKHPGLPVIYDIEEDDNHLFIIQEYIEGLTLAECIRTKGSFKPSEVIEMMRELLPVVDYLHTQRERPIIHRDIKPENVMITPKGRIKLIDFGIAREYKVSESSDTLYLGTRGYAAPEQFGRGQSDERTDIYALGMTMEVMLSGALSLSHTLVQMGGYGDDSSEIRYGVIIEDVIQKATEFEPDDRYSSIDAMSKVLFAAEFPETTLLQNQTEKLIKNPVFETIQPETRHRKRTIIGIQGAKSGVGVTHLSLMLAFSLKKMGYKATIVHEGSQVEYGSIYQYYEGNDSAEISKVKGFMMDGVEFIPFQDSQSLALLLAGNRDFYIIDCGTRAKQHQEWMRAHVRIGLYSSALWQMPFNKNFHEMYKGFPDVMHLFSPCEEKLLDAVLDEFEWRPKKYHKIPFNGNPFKANQESLSLTETILGLKKRGGFKISFGKGASK